MDESIYNLIPTEYEKRTKNEKYQSKFRSNVKKEYFDKAGNHQTMGEAKCQIREKADFLKKHEKEQVLPPRAQYKRPNPKDKIASVPSANDAPILGSKTTKDFITQNAVHNIGSVARKPAHLSVDTKGGDKQDLERAGLYPKFIHKKNYGATPDYIIKRHDEVKRAQDEYDAYVAENFRRGAMKKLTIDDREEILSGLKTNWEQIHHEYQGLSVVTDTVMKKYRKERMENDMKSLERDIEAIEKHDIIYIAN